MKETKRPKPSEIPDIVEDYLDVRAENINYKSNVIGIYYQYMTPPNVRRATHGHRKPKKHRQ